jgi:hypothetical protein
MLPKSMQGGGVVSGGVGGGCVVGAEATEEAR